MPRKKKEELDELADIGDTNGSNNHSTVCSQEYISSSTCSSSLEDSSNPPEFRISDSSSFAPNRVGSTETSRSLVCVHVTDRVEGEYFSPGDNTGEEFSDKVTLTPQQQEAREAVLNWLEMSTEQQYVLSGPAGTGKSTLIKYLREDFIKMGHVPAVASFTGKAVYVLKGKGIRNPQTLHTLLYNVNVRSDKKIYFTPKPLLDNDVNLVIVDESSMVSQELYDLLRSHNIRILFVGDSAQLEPVGDNPNIMRNPNFTLTEVHRQALDNPILSLATEIRLGRKDLPLGDFSSQFGKLNIITSEYGLKGDNFDIILCSYNNTRHSRNLKRRNELGRLGDPQVGDQVICLKNSKEFTVFNGLITTVQSIDRIDSFHGVKTMVATLEDGDDVFYDIPMRLDSFGKTPKNQMQAEKTKAVPFDFAYCLTVWKAQGSEWGRVLFLDEKMDKVDQNRLRYTAITRASKELTIVRR